MNEVHSRFLSAFAGGSIVTGLIMDILYSYQNILLSIVLGLVLAIVLIRKSPKE